MRIVFAHSGGATDGSCVSTMIVNASGSTAGHGVSPSVRGDDHIGCTSSNALNPTRKSVPPPPIKVRASASLMH